MQSRRPGDAGLIPGHEGPLEERMKTHSSIFAWRMPWIEETGGLWSIRLQSPTQLSMHTCIDIESRLVIALGRGYLGER